MRSCLRSPCAAGPRTGPRAPPARASSDGLRDPLAGAFQRSGKGVLRDPLVKRSIDPVQRRQVDDIHALDAGIVKELDAGEKAAGSNDSLLSSVKSNVESVSHNYAPGDLHDRKITANMVWNARTNEWRQSWYDQVDDRVRKGAKELVGDALYWAKTMKERSDLGYEDVTVTGLTLMGGELHDRGLGPTKVVYLIEELMTPPSWMTVMLKPEDRSIEEALLGGSDSLASKLNAKVSAGRRISTIEMNASKDHGTITEFIRPTLQSLCESTLRAIHFWDSSETVTTETVAFAFLTGLWDLHSANVMNRGGSPVLIDADVALRPTEFEKGPSSQQGFSTSSTNAVNDQLGGNGSGASQILAWAIEHPDDVVELIKAAVDNHKTRIVPAFTATQATCLQAWVLARQDQSLLAAEQAVRYNVEAVKTGASGSLGLEGELGDDRLGLWSAVWMETEIEKDYQSGVIPIFQYEPSTGLAFFHGRPIWKGTTLDDSMRKLRKRLEEAKG